MRKERACEVKLDMTASERENISPNGPRSGQKFVREATTSDCDVLCEAAERCDVIYTEVCPL